MMIDIYISSKNGRTSEIDPLTHESECVPKLMRIELKFRCQSDCNSIYMMIIIYTDGGERTVPGENETVRPGSPE